MTEDFKIYAKDFIAKSVVGGSQGDYELFYGSYTGIARIYDDYDNNAIIKCVKQVVSPKNVGVLWTILILWSDTLHKGRFAIIDENNEVVSLIDQYTSGVDIGCYYCIDLDEKGRLYGVEWFNQERVRFIMLNNVSVPRGTEYYADIRKTYDIPTINSHAPIQNSNTKGYIVKNDAKYGIVNYLNFGDSEIYTFEIDVENGNTWKEAKISSVMWESQKPFITYDNNGLFTFKILGNQAETNDPTLKLDIIVENNTTLNATQSMIITNSNGKTTLSNSDIWWIDNNNILVPFYDDTKFYLQKLDLSQTTFVQVYEENFYTQQIEAKFSSVNNYCFLHVVGKNYNAPGTPEEDEVENEGFKQAIYHIFSPSFELQNSIFEHILQEVDTHNLIPDWFGVKYYLVQNQYNLYNHVYSININDDDTEILYIDTSQEIYNENNYNGDPYYPFLQSALKPQQFILYNNDKILYARDVYNKTAYGNIIDTSLQIPNNLINNIEIENEQLWSTTKIVMNNETKSIIKNKYEELILNIRNRLNIIDNNDNQNLLLEETSAQVHQALAGITTTTYPGMCIWYAKVNYHDNTSENIAITSSRTDDITTISFDISVSKQIDSINFVSQTGIVYVTITPTLEIGKTYTIKQDVRIGD